MSVVASLSLSLSLSLFFLSFLARFPSSDSTYTSVVLFCRSHTFYVL